MPALYLTGKYSPFFENGVVRYSFEETEDPTRAVVAVLKRFEEPSPCVFTESKKAEVKALFRVPDDDVVPVMRDLFRNYLKIHSNKIKKRAAGATTKGVKTTFPAALFI
jgi:hypothetical protein